MKKSITENCTGDTRGNRRKLFSGLPLGQT
jgi:hypothetical protein